MSLGDPGEPQARSLYLYENKGLWAIEVEARSLYVVENKGLWAIEVEARSLYGYVNRGMWALVVARRALYVHDNRRDGEVFPWLMKISPTEQYRGGTVDLFGDGFGELVEAAADATVTTSSVSGGNVGDNAVDRAISEWVSTSGAAAWIRFTWGAPKVIVGIAIEGALANSWGIPLFRFSDGGSDVVGAAIVPPALADARDTEHPVGTVRAYYALPAARTTTYVEIAISSEGSGTDRGLSEVWIYEDQDAAAEGASVILNNDLLSETPLGIVSWSNRSIGLWPANGGLPVAAAITVTIPDEAVSGLVVVEETI